MSGSADNERTPRVNRHVERLRRYVPLDAGADQLVHEHVDDQAIDLPTAAESTIHAATQTPDVRVVLLTGDAGHGKTRLCCALLELLGLDKATATQAVRERADGRHDLAEVRPDVQLRIVKDISDFNPDDGAQLLRDAITAEARVTVVCANEGRLRDVVSRAPSELGVVLERLEDGLDRGDACASGHVVIVNLNFQSVAAHEGPLVEQLLDRWVGDGRNWSVCGSCSAESLCPIRENRRLLHESNGASLRRERITELLRIAERTGTVITIRELLVTIAFALASDLRCEDVHRNVQRSPVDTKWQWAHLFHEVLFERIALLKEKSGGLRVPASLTRLDPGRFADRRIDEELDIEEDESSFRPYDPTGDVIGVDWRDQTPEAARDEQLRLNRFLRRRAFFGSVSRPGSMRVGLRFAEEFDYVTGERSDRARTREIRDRVVQGLMAVQGLNVTGDRPRVFSIVEPALAGRRGGISILDRDVPLKDVEVLSLTEWWRQVLGRDPEVAGQVDWLERQIVVVVEGKDPIQLDLRAFELVCLAANGLDLATADPGVARRLLLRLASIAGAAQEVSRMQIVEPRGRWQIDLDVDDQLIGTQT